MVGSLLALRDPGCDGRSSLSPFSRKSAGLGGRNRDSGVGEAESYEKAYTCDQDSKAPVVTDRRRQRQKEQAHCVQQVFGTKKC